MGEDGHHDLVLLARRRGRAPRRHGLPGRRRHRHHRLPGRHAGQAPARRGPRRGGQDRAGQGGGPRHGRRPRAPAVLRGSRRGARTVRVELQEAAPADPGRGRAVLVGDPRRHLHRGVPPHPAAAHRDPARGPHRPADRRGRQDRRRGGGPAARGALGLPGHDPRAGHRRGGAAPVRRAHLQRHPRAVRGGQAPLPVPAPRLPRRRAGAGDRAQPGARPRGRRRAPARRRGRSAARAGAEEGTLDRGVRGLGAHPDRAPGPRPRRREHRRDASAWCSSTPPTPSAPCASSGCGAERARRAARAPRRPARGPARGGPARLAGRGPRRRRRRAPHRVARPGGGPRGLRRHRGQARRPPRDLRHPLRPLLPPPRRGRGRRPVGRPGRRTWRGPGGGDLRGPAGP